jgi:hypothetical protein
VLLVPKNITSPGGLDPVANNSFLVDVLATVQSLVKEFNLDKNGCRFIDNGGPNQLFP